MTQTSGEKEQTKVKGALRLDQNELMFGEGFSFSGYERDPLYLNLGNRKFLEISGVSGIDSISDGRAAVFADFDNDGDLDVFLTALQGQSHLLFRNNIGQAGHFVRVTLEGTTSGRDAFGAVVRVKTSAGTVTKIKNGGSGFLAQHDPRLLLGLGEDVGVDSIEISWPCGEVETFAGVPAGSSVVLREGSSMKSSREILITEHRFGLPDPLTRTETAIRGLRIAQGQALPVIPVRTMSSQETTLTQQLQPGRRTFLNLWATWCSPCAREMPELDRMKESLAANGVDLIGLNVNAEPDVDISNYLNRLKVSYPNLIGGVPAIEAIFATDQLAVPLSILVDDQGVVLEVLEGWSARTQQRLSELGTSQ